MRTACAVWFMKAGPLALIHRVRRSAWILPLAALAAVVIFVINEAAYTRSTASLALLGDRATARTQVQQVWRSLLDAETGQRGYLLTGRSEYLQPYQAATGEVQAALAWLAAHYGADREAAPVLAELTRTSEAKLSELATTLQLHARSADGAWRELMLTDIGREKMEGLRSAASQLLALETRRVADERREVFATLQRGRIGVGAMTALSLLGLVLFLQQTRAFDRAQKQHALAMQAERDRLQREAARRTADLTELARHLQTVREDERSRLARELHDELGALLTAAKLDAARLKRALGVLTPDVQARLVHLNESVNRGIEMKRRIIEELRPSSLNNLGLVSALQILTRDHAARSEIRLETRLDPVALADSAQITVYRLVQEALTNIARHAAARSVQVTLQAAPRDGCPGACVVVQDDGRGFDAGARRGTSHGLMGMAYRVEAEGGTMTVHSQPGQGTRVEAWLPLAPVEAPAMPEPASATAAVG